MVQCGDRTRDKDRFAPSFQEVEKLFKILLGELRMLTSRVVGSHINYLSDHGWGE